jgi:hypothetical protein
MTRKMQAHTVHTCGPFHFLLRFEYFSVFMQWLHNSTLTPANQTYANALLRMQIEYFPSRFLPIFRNWRWLMPRFLGWARKNSLTGSSWRR